jgi:hypothetical protein
MPPRGQRSFFRMALLSSTTPAQIIDYQIDWQALRFSVRAQVRALLGLEAQP